MSDMIERVAAAIMNVGLDKNAKYAAMAGWETADKGDKDVARDFARAAIEAMREPTVDMLEAARLAEQRQYSKPGQSMLTTNFQMIRTHHKAMIDAALTLSKAPSIK